MTAIESNLSSLGVLCCAVPCKLLEYRLIGEIIGAS
jgi:hypothetical protein